VAAPFDVTAELHLGGAWVDVTSDVRLRDGVSITRGQADEGARADVARCTLTFNNRLGKYSPRNPTGPYYGQLGRNTPLRVSVASGDTYLSLPGDTTSKATAPDAAPLGITGDIDVRVDLEVVNWRQGADLVSKYQTASDQRSWAFYLLADGTGRLAFTWSTTGTFAATLDRISTAPVPVPVSGRQAVRATLDVNNGASGHTVTFYTAPTIAGPWTQLGDPVVTAGTTNIFDSTAAIELGDEINLVNAPVNGRMFGFELRNGIGGTVVANPDFTSQTPGATSFADTASSPNTWTIQGAAEITDREIRFTGEVSSWPPRWDVTGRDVWTPVEASGILRRLGQGASALRSALYRGLTNPGLPNAPVAYWPCEDADGASSFASGIGGSSMTFTGTPDLAAYSEFDASEPIPLLNDSVWTGVIPAYAVTGQATVRFLLAVADAGISGDEALMSVYTSGSAAQWTIRYGDPGGDLKVQAYDEDGNVLLDSGFIAFAINGKRLRLALDLLQNGANIEWDLSTLEPGDSTGLTIGGTLNSQSLGQMQRIVVDAGGGITDTAMGHISVQPAITSIFDLGEQLAAYAGEKAGRRIARLCAEEQMTLSPVGDLDDSVAMGPQRPAALLDLIGEAADADMGILYEPRDRLGLAYRTRASFYNQTPALALDYEARHLSPPLEPVDDDQATRNDVTVTRTAGSSARAVITTGALSTAAPPDGVGRYDESVTVNVQTDTDLPDQAQWRAHLGTVDETRYPQITTNMAAPAVRGDADLTASVIGFDVGDRLTIDNPPPWLPPEQISQIVRGYAERVTPYEWELTLNCSPESPYQVATYSSANLVGNPSFETDTSGWGAQTNSAIARVTSQKYIGAASLQITRTATNPPFNLYGASASDVRLETSAGDTVTISCYIYVPAASLPHVTGVVVGGDGTDFSFADTSHLTADTWHRVSRTVPLAATLDNIQFQIWTDNGHTNGQVVAYLDAVHARVVASAERVSRYQPDSSTLASSVTSSATTLSVASAGPLWTTDVAEFPFDLAIGGERMTVTAISGASSPQTFTVVRSANGVVKVHAAGAVVKLAQPAIRAL
jgi:hypothetical protein